MKKILATALAAMSLVACLQEEVVTVPQTDAITFEGAYVNVATRAAADPSTTTASIAGFDVWAFMNEWDGTVLTDEDITRTSSGWTYANTQYWTPNNKYYFAALAPMNSANVTETLATSNETAKLGLGEIAFTNVDGSEDLLYAATTVTAPDYDQLKLNNMPPVKFEFSHLLSKVKFTFTNGFKTDNAYVEIEDIKMTAPKSGTIDLAVANWWDNDDWTLGTESFELEFGNVAKLAMGTDDECAQERLTIPAEAEQVYDITFTVKLYMGNQLALETVKTSTVTGVAFEMGKAYNLTAEINPDNLELPSIEFDVIVKEWEEAGDVAHPIVATFEGAPYTSLQDAIDAAVNGGTIFLTSKVNETVTIVEKAGVELVIDGQDNKFDGQIKIHNGSSYNDGKVTIKNVNFETNVLENNFVYAVDFGNAKRYSQNITVEDCTFTALAGSKAENTAVGVKVNATKNLVIKNCVATNMHSLLQAQSCDAAVTVEGVEITGKNGVAFGNTAFPTLKDATITATGYGVRADANASRGALVVENVTVDANRPIVVRKTTTPYSVTVNGTNNFTAGDGFDVIFTKGDDEGALVAPAAANVTFNGPATLSVYPGYSDAENTYVATPDALQEALEEVVAGTEDKNIVLSGDIDLASLMTRSAVVSNWTPVGTSEKPFTGVFDGNGHTIKNLALVETEAKEGKAYIGFFGYAKNATIKNLTFENVYINIPCLDIEHSQGHIGAVAGSLEGTSTIENVTVKGDIQVYATQEANGASRVAVVAGGNSYGDVTMKNVHVIANEGSFLKANNNTGALAGQLQGKSVFEDCSSNINVTVNKFFAGGLIGIAPTNATFTNCHTTGDVAVVAGRAGRGNDHYRVGGIAGGWADGPKNVCTLNGCTYTGTLTGINADGSVATTFDYAGYVGRGYTLANCGGSKVVIDGTEYVQLNNTDYGVYVINGTTVTVGTADALVAALASKYDVLLTNDIKIEPAKMSNAYGATGINVVHGQTIDGDGHTLNIKGAGGTWDSGINTTGGVIKNLTVTGSFRGIFINHTSDHSEKVILENVTIGGNGTVYTISCDQGLYQGIEATNCTFNGWTSYAKTAGEAKFVNCYFGEGAGYKYCRPYSNTEFVNCTFCPGYTVDKSKATVTFTDCTFEE